MPSWPHPTLPDQAPQSLRTRSSDFASVITWKLSGVVGGVQVEDGAPLMILELKVINLLVLLSLSLSPPSPPPPPSPTPITCTTARVPTPSLKIGWCFCVAPMPRPPACLDSHVWPPRLLTTVMPRPSPPPSPPSL